MLGGDTAAEAAAMAGSIPYATPACTAGTDATAMEDALKGHFFFMESESNLCAELRSAEPSLVKEAYTVAHKLLADLHSKNVGSILELADQIMQLKRKRDEKEEGLLLIAKRHNHAKVCARNLGVNDADVRCYDTSLISPGLTWAAL